MSTYTKLVGVPVVDLTPCPQHKYKMLEVLGEGCFGKVAKGCNRFTKELVALKVLKKEENTAFYFRREVQMLGLIKELEPDVFNIVEFIEHFEFDGQQCMAFEMLDQSVHDLLNQEFSFSLNEIRPMAKQLLTALLGLQSVGVLHSDIKPDNIMLVNHDKQPFKVKLIDFGVARHISEVRLGTIMQPIGYRAPEVTLGLPLSEAVDVWALACCLMLWYLGWHNLTSLSEFDNLTMIVDILGLPANELLNEGIHTSKYFVQEDSKWRLKTLQEYKYSSGKDPKMYSGRETTTLEELIKVPLEFQSNIECSDKEAFYDLLKKMFEINPKKRITPVEALLHPFITMSHLPQGKCYTEVALQYMSVAETDFEPLQTEGLEHIAEMFTQEREAVRAARKLATPASNPATSQNAARRHTSEGSDISESGKSYFSSGLIAASNSSGYLSTDEEESMGLSYEAGNARWREKSSGEITIGSLYKSSGLHTTEEPASELVPEKMSTLATHQNADGTVSSYEVTKWRDINETGKSSFSSDFEDSSSSSGYLSQNEESSFLSAGLVPSSSYFSSGLIAAFNSSGYLSTDEEESMGLSYEAGNARWREKSPGEITIGSLYKSSGLHTTEEPASELVPEKMSTLATHQNADGTVSSHEVTKWKDTNKTGKSSFSSDFEDSSSSSGYLSQNEESSFLSAGLVPSYTTKWRDINKTGKSSFSSDFEDSSSSSGYLSQNEESSFLSAGLGPSYTRRQGKSLGEIIIGSPSTSSEPKTTEEPGIEEPFQGTMRQSQEEDANSKVTSPHMAATFEVADSTFIGALLEIGDLGLAAVLEAAKEELSVDCSEILEDIKKLFQDGEATEAQIDEVKGKASKSVVDRLWALFSRLFTLLKPRPKKPFFSKPKWVKHFPLFTRKSTKSGLSRH